MVIFWLKSVVSNINIRKGEERANIEIQRVKKEDEVVRVINYAGGLITDFVNDHQF